MNIRFYKTFSKRKNSTKQVGTATYSTHTCTLKQPTSMHDPIVQLATSEMLYTYAYIPDWSSYYFVQDVVSLHNGLVEYHLIEDVLATYKTTIGSVSAHVIYSSSNYDTWVNDARITVSSDRDVYGAKTGSAVLSSTGCYVLTVYDAQNLSSVTGFGQSYLLNASAMGVVRRWFGDTNIYDALADYFHGTALDGVFDCIWVPFDPTWFSSVSPANIHIGNHDNASDNFPFSTGDACYRLINYAIHTATITIGVNRSTPLDFRSVEPYTTGMLYLPGIGTIELSMNDWKGETDITIDMVMEAITGNVKYIIKKSNGMVIQECSCNLAARCPLGQMVHDGTGIINGALTGITKGIAGDAVGMVVGLGQAVMSAFKHSPSITGGVGGSRTAIAYPYIAEIEFRRKTGDPADAQYIVQRGRPCGQTVQISTLSGYVQCEGASVSGSMTEHEREEINNFLNTGFYYE